MVDNVFPAFKSSAHDDGLQIPGKSMKISSPLPVNARTSSVSGPTGTDFCTALLEKSDGLSESLVHASRTGLLREVLMVLVGSRFGKNSQSLRDGNILSQTNSR
jgi:hypothetical protein